ncbi:MAG: DUF547 domain-containing protein [Hyphomicrobiaceae bacterium]
MRHAETSIVRRDRRQVMTGLAGLGLAAALPIRPAQAMRLEHAFAARPGGSARIDHSAWTHLLERYRKPGADGIARLDYRSWKQSGRRALASYLGHLVAGDPRLLDPQGQFAYWINLYNAKTVDVVLDHYPVHSIKDINLGGSLLAAVTGGPWAAKIVRLAGIDLSLDDIEHEILRPVFKEARVHYALNCASLGCPNLSREAFEATTLETMLDAAAAEFINHPRAVRRGATGLVVSSLYEWFEDDFGGGEIGVRRHLRRYAGPALAGLLSDQAAISGYEYDWTLNDV